MELILYNKLHWLDELEISDPVAFAALMLQPGMRDKYNARYQRGDIVEVKEDGFFTGVNARGFNRNEMTLVKYPGAIAIYGLKNPKYDISGKMLYKREWKSNINITGVSEIEVSSVGEIQLEQKALRKAELNGR